MKSCGKNWFSNRNVISQGYCLENEMVLTSLGTRFCCLIDFKCTCSNDIHNKVWLLKYFYTVNIIGMDIPKSLVF